MIFAAVFYSILSLSTFIAYAIDKTAARRGTRRTRERTLHLMALAGGWPGGFMAQRILRHKSRKESFQLVFWTTVVLHCAVAWLAWRLLSR